MDKSAAGQRVVVRNRYATAEYKSIEDAADALASVGVLTRDEVMELLSSRVGWVNGFAVSYPEG